MNKITPFVFLALVASAAGCEYHRYPVQEVRMSPQDFDATEVAAQEDPSGESDEALKAVEELQKQIDELKQLIEEQKEALAPTQEEEQAPTEPTAEETPAEPAPEETPEPPAETPPSGPEAESPESPESEDTTPLKVSLAYYDGDVKTFTIAFSEAVDFASIVDHLSIAVYAPSTGDPVPLEGVFSADVNGPQIVKFILKNPLTYLGWGKTVYTLKIFGADSATPERAAEDQDGHAMEHEVNWTFDCVETPDYFAFHEAHCE